MVRRFIASCVAVLLLAVGFSAWGGELPAAHADDGYRTITGTVSFPNAPTWASTDRTFTAQLLGSWRHWENDRISVTYPSPGTYSITYPEDRIYGSATIFVTPSNPAYFPTFYGGVLDYAQSTHFYMQYGQTPLVDSIPFQLGASISGSITTASGASPQGIQAIASRVSGYLPSIDREADIAADGSFHIVGLRPGDYNVGFIPRDVGAGPGAGMWWKSKPSLDGATVVTLTTAQQKAGITQVLPAGGVISGKLTDSQGRVVTGAVAIYNAAATSDSYSSLVQQTWVAADGSYTFWGLPFGKYKLGFTTGVRPSIAGRQAGPQLQVPTPGGPSPAPAPQVEPSPTPSPTAAPTPSVPQPSPSPTAPPTSVPSPIPQASEPPKTSGPAVITPASQIVRAVAIDPENEGGATLDGVLAQSEYPYHSAWHTGSASSFATAKVVTISTSKPMLGNINGVLPLDQNFTAWQARERLSGGNPAEKRVTCACADPVDTLSGEFSESQADLDLPGAGLPVQLDRHYSAAVAGVDGPFGFGSSSSLSAHLQEEPGTESNPYSTVVVTQEGGSTITFTPTSSGDFIAPDRVNASLTRDYSAGEWVVTRNETDVLRFSEAGALVSHQDLHGNVVTYDTDAEGHVTSVSGSGGRSIALTWADGHVTQATDSAGRGVSYVYNELGELTSFAAADGRVSHFGYNTEHRMTSKEAPGGGVVTNVYDTEGRVTNQTDALGRETRFTYAGNGIDGTTTVVNPAGVTSTYQYAAGTLVQRTDAVGTTSAVTTKSTFDAALNLVKQTDALGKITVMTYDDAGNMLTSTDSLGHTTSFQYDSLHNVTSVTDALGRVTTATYDGTGSKTSATAASGATSTWAYNSNGTLAYGVDPLGATTTYGYDAAGLLTSTTDAFGRTTSIGYDAAGHVTSTTDANGASSTVSVDPLGRPIVAVDPVGSTTAYEYDAAGNVTTQTAADASVTTTSYNAGNEPISHTDALGHTTSITYTPLGKVATVTDPLGGVTTTTYDPLGRPTVVADPKNLKTTTTYNKNGLVVQLRSPAGNITKFAYDAASRKISTTDPMGNVTNFTYDVANQLLTETDPLGRVTTTGYDVDGRVLSTTGMDGHAETVTYDAAGRQTSFTDADGNLTAYAYDELGQLTSRTAPGGLVTSYDYDMVGQVNTLTKPDGSTVEYAHDAARRLISSTPSAGTPISYTYDELGRRVTMTDETGTSHYQYSATGQPTAIMNGAGTSVTYGYDAAGRNTSLGYPGGKTVAYAYDAAGRMTTLTDWANRKFTFAWTGDGLVSKQTDPNKVATTTTYNKNDQTTGITVAKTSAPTATLATYQYGFDAASQLTSTTFADPLHTALGGDTTVYGYDTRGQLGAVSTGGSYAATAAGLLTQTPDGSVNTYNGALQLIGTANAVAATSSTFAYDGNGARAAASTTTSSGTVSASYTHSWTGALAQVHAPDATVGYTTSGDGLRQSRTVGGVSQQWLWDTTAAIPLLLKDGSFTYLYGPDVTPVAQIDGSGAIQYLHGDNVGSVRLITSSTAAVVGSADYTPYGAATSTGARSAFGYAGSWTDPVTGLDYLRAREYDPATGQFLQVDPALDTTRQAYAYAGNDPLAEIDPLGLCTSAGEDWGCISPWTGGPNSVSPEEKALNSWIAGRSPRTVTSDLSAGLARDLRTTSHMKAKFAELERLAKASLANGDSPIGQFLDASYVAGNPITLSSGRPAINPRLIQDAGTLARRSLLGVQSGVDQRVAAYLGSYEMFISVVDYSADCESITFAFSGGNSMSMSSAISPAPGLDFPINAFTELTGMAFHTTSLRSVRQNFVWSETHVY